MQLNTILSVIITSLAFLPSTIAAIDGHCSSVVHRTHQAQFQGVNRDFDVSYPAFSGETNNCILPRGSKGAGVKALQQALNSCHIVAPTPELDEDGNFGSLTEAALRDAQKEVKVKVDGTYGPDTAAKLRFRGVISPKPGAVTHCFRL